MVVDLWSPRRGGKNKNNKKTERGGQEMYTNIYRREVLPGRRRRLLVLYVDVDVHIFNIKNKVERGVELKFSPVGC